MPETVATLRDAGMTCPLSERLMRLANDTHGVVIQLAIYARTDDIGPAFLCLLDRKPMNSDSNRGSGRGHDCICEAVRNLECELGIMPPPECLGCEAGQAIGD